MNDDKGIIDDLGRFLTGLRANARAYRTLFLAALALLLAANVFLRPEHPHLEAEAVPGFWALFGLAVAVAMALAMKGVVAEIIGVDEGYYDDK